MITWLMVGLLLFTESACDRGKNAVSNKNGKNENVTAAGGNGSGGGSSDKQGNVKATAGSTADEEDIYRLTCYTCVNVSDNKMCNEWAIDTPCPTGGGDFCRSLHILDSRGQSVLVSKSCANKIECSPASVGCVPVDTQKICISCCDTSYCNVESPTNATNATYSRKRPERTKGLKKKKKKKKKKTGQIDQNNEELQDDDNDDNGAYKSYGSDGAGLAFTIAFATINVFLINRAYH